MKAPKPMSRRDVLYLTLKDLDPKAARGKSKARIGVLGELILRARANAERRAKRFTDAFTIKVAERPRLRDCGKAAPRNGEWRPCTLAPGHPGACYHRHRTDPDRALQTPLEILHHAVTAPRRSGTLSSQEQVALSRAGVDELQRKYLVSDEPDVLAAPALFLIARALLAQVVTDARWLDRVKLLDARARRAVDALEGRS